ncbi:MAG: hypothetical protein G01um101448_490 [Parcubacteria group bacterium Gr01-1014_48]|nr:MAG: hypothetical protein Greene041614_809 [Parcubacteria group bacterium Greene0416_14]TSC73847.1 MAG: hypothetical protein G01um101448_490 [Parcubacteria group bacterium Gr01-1014_48]TSD00400.1 MAG: hypothetical protein Greene101415_858 [Parcubacteria group bacterium Greene1014_15]TSD07734.1 MAG: hypothetical protein Greene07144_766 [Parcubacteria group bacterium Greene0714_4]
MKITDFIPIRQALVVFFMLILIGMLLFLLSPVLIPRVSNVTAEQYIIPAIENCYAAANQNACYIQAAVTLAKRFQPSVVLQIVARNEKQPHIFQVCHEVLHFFGRAIFNRTKNVSRALIDGDATCFAGYYHGVLEGYFLENGLLGTIDDAFFAKKISSLCEQNDTTRTKKDVHECLHGLGHAFMFATDADLPRSLSLCDIFPRDDATWCYSGVFMENSTSATNKDHPSKYFKKDDPGYPCSILDEKYLSMCYTLQTQYVVNQNGGDWEQTFAFCQKIPRAYRKDCAMAIGGSISQYDPDPHSIKESCEKGPDSSDQKSCVDGVVGALGEHYNNPFDHVVTFCSILDVHKAACYQQMNNLMGNWSRDMHILQAGCDMISEAAYRTSCLQTLE